MNKKILCTLGPSSFNEKTIFRLSKIGVYLFRINLSHTDIEDITPKINMIRQYSDTPICLDSEGAQIRTGFIPNGKCTLKENSKIKIVGKKVPENSSEISLNYSSNKYKCHHPNNCKYKYFRGSYKAYIFFKISNIHYLT